MKKPGECRASCLARVTADGPVLQDAQRVLDDQASVAQVVIQTVGGVIDCRIGRPNDPWLSAG